MKRKIFVMMIAFLGMCSVGYAQNNDLFASTEKPMQAYTGKVNQIGYGGSATVGEKFMKGDRILMGLENPYTGKPLSWQLIKHLTYTDYGCTTTTICPAQPAVSAWHAISNDSIGKTVAFADKLNWIDTGTAGQSTKEYKYSNVYSMFLKPLNLQLASSSNDYRIVAPRNLENEHRLISTLADGTPKAILKAAAFSTPDLLGRNMYELDVYTLISTDSAVPIKLDIKDRKFTSEYFTVGAYSSSGTEDINTIWYVDLEGLHKVLKNSATDNAYDIRPNIMLDMNKAVFSLSLADATVTKPGVTEPDLPNGYTNLYKDATGSPMKVRLKNSTLTATLSNIQRTDSDNTETAKVEKNSKVHLDANANTGSTTDGVNTVSVLVFQENTITGNDDFKYYKPLEAAKGEGLYEFDTTGMEIGKYKIAIVNEVYNEASTAPADSSLISEVKELEIVAPLSNLTFAPTSNLKYNSNVNASGTIGTISSQNGAGTPIYTLVKDFTQALDVDKFEIGNDGVSIQVKGNALDAGTYKFKIQAQDANGHPTTPLEINATITVAKGEITSVAFDDPNQTKKSITDAQTSWNETASPTPSTGVKVKYSIDSGNLNLLDIHADTGAITMKATTGFGKVVIKAAADDDVSTGKDNFNPKSITKDVVIYQDVDGSFTPHSASSNATDPTFSASDTNVKGNGIIGIIAGTKGTPDNLTSGTITYTYTLKTEGGSNYFIMSGSTLKVKNGVDLGVGSYTIKINVADKFGNKDISVIINVGVAAAEGLDFYDDKNAVITRKGINTAYGSTNVKVLAKGADVTNTSAVNYSIEDGSTNIITVHPTSGALTIHGVGTTKVKATKAGASGQAEANQTMSVTITKGNQVDFKFVDFFGSSVQLPTKEDGSYEEYKDPTTSKVVPYEKNKTFQIFTNGGNGTVTYALKVGSESDVIDVDADGTIHIKNATVKAKINRVSVQATSTDASGHYLDKTLELVMNIDQGEQTLSFVEQPVMIPHGNNVSVMPTFNAMNISNIDGTISDTEVYLDQSTITYTNGTANVQVDSLDGVSLKSNYTGLTGVDGTIEAIKDGNRNYKQVKVNGTFHIMDPSESDFAISYPNEVFYGDSFTFTPRGDDSTSTNVVYHITANQSAIADWNATTKKASAKQVGNTTFTIQRSADGEVTKEKTVQVQVKQKEIQMKIENKSRYVGEANPSFTYEDFTAQLVTWNGVQDIINDSDIKFNTTAIGTSLKGSYTISLNTTQLSTQYPNYTFTAANGELSVLEDAIEQGWYHMVSEDGKPYANTWINQSVKIISNHAQYTQLSNDKVIWNDELLITREGKNETTFYMNKASGAISGSKVEMILIDRTPPKITSIKGQEKKSSRMGDLLNAVTFNSYYKPGVSIEIQGEDTSLQEGVEMSGLSSITYEIYKEDETTPFKTETKTTLNSISFTVEEPGKYKVCAMAEDKAGNSSLEACEEIAVKKIDVDVDKDGEDDFLDPDGDGCPDINIAWINEDKTWTKLNVDQNGNDIPDMNIDSNGDGVADLNVDTDGDKRPDLNLVILKKEDWKPTICVTTQPEEYCTGTTVKAKINIDIHAGTVGSPKDIIPDINIDTTGDMKADINITKPNEEKPFLNITSKHSTWKPEKDFTFEKFSYDTDATMKAILNVDSDKDGKPDLNIDFNGDGKPDLNIDANGDGIPETDIDSDGNGEPDVNVDTDKDGKPDENIIEIKAWKPETDGSKEGFIFDTMSGINGKDQLEDNDIVVEKPGGVFLPNYALKVERVTDSANELIKKDIINKANGQVIKEIYDVKLLEDEVQIQPDGKLKIRLPMPEGIVNPRLVIQLADGTYFKVKPEIIDGYLVYESDYLGLVSIIGDHEEVILPDDDVNIPDAGGAVDNDTSTSVKGAYTAGTNTGDDTNMSTYAVLLLVGCMILIIARKRSKEM